MISNLIIWLVVLVLAIGAGWLTWRAVRAKRTWVKIAGGLGAGLLTLVLAAVAFMSARGIASTYFPGAADAPALTVAGTPEQIARGDYLVNLNCIGCHSAGGADGMPTEAHPLNGGWNIAASEGFGFVGDMVAENLTPGGKLADYSDGELFRSIRHAITKEGDRLGFMSLLPVTQLSDNDIESIIAYMRTLPPTEQTSVTGDKLSFVGMIMFGAGMFGTPELAPDSIVAPPQGPTADYGKYVATFGDCRGCHGPDMTGTPASAMGPAVPDPRPLVGGITQAEFVEMMRSGVRPGNRPFPDTMPYQNAAKMTDGDLAALYAYLTTNP